MPRFDLHLATRKVVNDVVRHSTDYYRKLRLFRDLFPNSQHHFAAAVQCLAVIDDLARQIGCTPAQLMLVAIGESQSQQVLFRKICHTNNRPVELCEVLGSLGHKIELPQELKLPRFGQEGKRNGIKTP